MDTANFENAASYKTIFAAACHLSASQWQLLLSVADARADYFCHRISPESDTGIILRMDPLGDEIENVLREHGFDDITIDAVTRIKAADFDAVHFDRDADLLAFIPWFTDSGMKVTPLGYDLDVVSYYDCTPEQQALILSHLDESEEEAAENLYFIANEVIYSMADFMRLGVHGSHEMQEYDFIGAMGESQFSSLFIGMCDGDDRVNLVRVSA